VASAPARVRQRLTIAAGMKLPTAPLERDPAGNEVHPDLQPGCGSIVPLLGASYVWTSALWSAWASASLLFPVSVRTGAHPGDSLRSSLGLQLQPTRILATRLGVHGRLDGTGELAGEVLRSSGGASVHVAPELVLSPTQDVVVAVGASFPWCRRCAATARPRRSCWRAWVSTSEAHADAERDGEQASRDEQDGAEEREEQQLACREGKAERPAERDRVEDVHAEEERERGQLIAQQARGASRDREVDDERREARDEADTQARRHVRGA